MSSSTSTTINQTVPTPTLGSQMSSMLQSINTLILKAQTQSQINQLIAQRDTLLTQIGDLIDKNLNQTAQEYVSATKALQNASQQIQSAITNLSNTATAIQYIGSAISLIVRVIAMA